MRMRRGIGIVSGAAQARLKTIAETAIPALVALASVGTLMVPAALAKEQQDYYKGTQLTPDLSVSTSTAQAGASPDIEIQVRKTPNHCASAPPPKYPSFYAEVCEEDGVYLEQDLKEMTLRLPPGALANINAAAQCDLSDSSRWPLVFLYGPDESGNNACGPESQVGVVSIGYSYICEWGFVVELPTQYVCSDFLFPSSLPTAGLIFNGVPGPGEQAHLYVLVGICDSQLFGYPTSCDPNTGLTGYYRLVRRIDIAARLRTESDWGIDATVRDMPDTLCLAPYDGKNPARGCPPEGPGTNSNIAFPVDDMTVTLFGQVGAGKDRPFTLNPTSCQRRDLSSAFTGYAANVWDTDPSPAEDMWFPGSGTGITVDDAARYPVTGCNSLDYSPEVELTLDDPAPKRPAAITSVVTQGVGEQTTRQVTVDIPKSFKVNLQNTLSQCSDEQAASLSCPEEAKVGEVQAESNLLPETGDLAGPLRGAVYVGPTSTEDIRLFTILHGFVDAKLEGRLEMRADGSSRAVFDLPELPQQKITLTLYGGAQKALVTTPKACGTHHLKASFTSHQGAVAKRDVPVSVSCTDPDFDVDLGSRRPGAHPTLSLTARSAGLESVAFELSRQLKIARHPARLAALGRYGTLHLDTEDGLKELKVKLLKGGTLGSLSFSATEGKTQATSLGAYDITVAARGKRSVLKRKRKGKRVAAQGPTRIWIGRLPAGTTQVSLELQGQKDDLIQNPRRCKVRGKRLKLGFSARITGTDESRTAIPRSVSMSCKKSRAGRRK